MGRKLRKVAANWEHPKDDNGHYIPLLGYSFSEQLKEWKEENDQWQKGFRRSYSSQKEYVTKEDKYKNMSFEEWNGKRPVKRHYMPEWKPEERTHIQLYETCTEGTPITPVFHVNEFEKLCEYAAANATTFGNFTATKEEWMKMLMDDNVHHQEGNIIFV